jgi:AcrR family transcriptional regulator
VDRISSKLNVTKGAFYHYNATKDDLVVACFQRTFDVLWRAIDAAESGGDDGLEIMHSLLQAVVQLQVGPAPLLRTSALSTVPEEIRDDLMFRLRQISIRLGSMLCDGIADGSIRPLDASITAQILTAGINAASELTWWQPGENPETGARLFVDAMVRGVIHP